MTSSTPGVFSEIVFDLSRRCVGALQRRGVGQLQPSEEIALVFLRQEAAGMRLPSNPERHREADQQQHGDDALADQEAADADVAVGGAAEDPVEPVEEPLPAGRVPFFFGRKQQRARARATSVSALKAEMITETAIVTANC